jgi:hypothetical protein
MGAGGAKVERAHESPRLMKKRTGAAQPVRQRRLANVAVLIGPARSLRCVINSS